MADAGPLVSVVIPTYNREGFLRRSMDSVLRQTYSDWELIIVDDRSTDGTESLVHQYMDDDKRIAYAKNTHRPGPAGARNQGSKLANGEYIAFLDSDDEWKSHHLETIIDEFARYPDIDWIYTDSEISEGGKIVTESVFGTFWKRKNDLAVTRRGALSVFEGKDLLVNAIRFGLCAGCQCSVIRRNVFATNAFDENLLAAEDWLFLLEVIYNRYKVAYLEDVHFTYFSHTDGISANPKSKPARHNLVVYREFEKCYMTLRERLQLSAAEWAAVEDKLAELYFWFFDGYFRLSDYGNANAYLLKSVRMKPLRLLFLKNYFMGAIQLALSRFVS